MQNARPSDIEAGCRSTQVRDNAGECGQHGHDCRVGVEPSASDAGPGGREVPPGAGPAGVAITPGTPPGPRVGVEIPGAPLQKPGVVLLVVDSRIRRGWLNMTDAATIRIHSREDAERFAVAFSCRVIVTELPCPSSKPRRFSQ